MEKLVMNLDPRKFLINLIGIIVATIFIIYASTTYAKQTKIVQLPGPAMYCGPYNDLLETISHYSEEKFLVLSGKQDNAEDIYYTIHRNLKTGAWSFVAHNIKNAPKNVACLMNGGFKSYILPSMKELEPMITKQINGLDKIKPTKETKNNDKKT